MSDSSAPSLIDLKKCDDELREDVKARLMAFAGELGELNYEWSGLVKPLPESGVNIHIDCTDNMMSYVTFSIDHFTILNTEMKYQKPSTFGGRQYTVGTQLRELMFVFYKIELTSTGRLELVLPEWMEGNYRFDDETEECEVNMTFPGEKGVATIKRCQELLADVAGVKLGERTLIHDYGDEIVPYFSGDEMTVLYRTIVYNAYTVSNFGLKKNVQTMRNNLRTALSV